MNDQMALVNHTCRVLFYRQKRKMLIVHIFFICLYILTFYRPSPNGLAVKNLPANAGDANLILESGRSPGEGNGNPLQYSCLENSMDRGARRAPVHGVAQSRT